MTGPSITLKVSFRTCKRRGEPESAHKRTGPTPIARRVALAHHIETLIDRGELADFAEAARRFGLTRARITQVSDLALLCPTIQTAILLGQVEPRDRHLREVGRHPLWKDQRRVFAELFPDVLQGEES